MKVGSLVELIDDNWGKSVYKDFPVKGMVYEVTGFVNGFRGLGIYIREKSRIIRIKQRNGLRRTDLPHFLASRFRELQPPMTISIEEILTEKV